MRAFRLLAFMYFIWFLSNPKYSQAQKTGDSLLTQARFLNCQANALRILAAGINTELNKDSLCYYLQQAHSINPSDSSTQHWIKKYCVHRMDSRAPVSFWSASLENGGRYISIYRDTISCLSSDVSAFITELNKTFNKYQPLVIFDSLAKQTLHISFDHPEKYTEQMGTTGAQEFLAMLVFTLTELPEVQQIQLHVEIGSHGKPGVYDRKQYLNNPNFKIESK